MLLAPGLSFPGSLLFWRIRIRMSFPGVAVLDVVMREPAVETHFFPEGDGFQVSCIGHDRKSFDVDLFDVSK